MFTTRYYDDACVERSAKTVNGYTTIIYRVKAVTGVYDFTLAADPAYPDTSVEAREFVTELKKDGEPEQTVQDEKYREQVSEMRQAASRVISF
jgi:hypothetical protein